jgi:hypothetical protein
LSFTADSLGVGVLLPLLLLALGAYAYRGWFSRYTADDYCTAGAERLAGFLGAQVFWYQTWSGRFTYYIISSLIELTGPTAVQILPALALAAWLRGRSCRSRESIVGRRQSYRARRSAPRSSSSACRARPSWIRPCTGRRAC